MAFSGGLTIVLDIIGPERLREISFKYRPIWPMLLPAGMLKPSSDRGRGSRNPSLWGDMIRSVAAGVISGLAYLAVSFIAWVATNRMPDEAFINGVRKHRQWHESLAVSVPTATSITIVVILASILGARGRQWAIRLFENEWISSFLRIGSLFALLIGFHFDLLAS